MCSSGYKWRGCAGSVSSPQMESLAEHAADLVQQKVATHSEVVAAIRKAIIARSEGLPPIRVLHCTVPGGFGLAKAFVEYAHGAAGEGVDSSRAILSQLIGPFGRECGERYPNVRRAVRQFEANDFGALFADAGTIDAADKRLALLSSGVVQMPGEERTKAEEETARCLAIEHYRKYAALDKLYGHFSPAVVTRMVDAQCMPAPAMTTDADGFSVDFARAVELLGDDSPDIWLHQRLFPPAAMAYLTSHPEDVPDPEGDDAGTDERLGLMFAAAAWCRLAIKDVPALCECALHTSNNGVETVGAGEPTVPPNPPPSKTKA
jgi:hypothetical protein